MCLYSQCQANPNIPSKNEFELFTSSPVSEIQEQFSMSDTSCIVIREGDTYLLFP